MAAITFANTAPSKVQMTVGAITRQLPKDAEIHESAKPDFIELILPSGGIFPFDWQDVTSPVATSRTDLVFVLAVDYFSGAGVSATIDTSGGPVATEIQIGGAAIAETNPLPMNIEKVNGKQPGTAFGDDFTVTFRIARVSATWAQGLTNRGVEIVDGTHGGWRLLPAVAPAIGFDGTSEVFIASGAPTNERILINTALPNRYEAGHLSYAGYTVSFDFSDTNGDCWAYIGFMQKGPRSLNLQNTVKEALMWGRRKIGGVMQTVHIVVKNYVVQSIDPFTMPEWVDFDNLTIFEHKFGYYGIHPSIQEAARVDAVNKIWNKETVYLKGFAGRYTSVSSPNLSLGVWIENAGNTGRISLFNGSIEYGNYQTMNRTGDAGSRSLVDSIRLAGPIAVDADDTDLSGLIGVYHVPDVVPGIVSLTNGGATVATANFANSVGNRLLNVTASAVPGNANRPIRLRIWIMPVAAITLVVGQDFTMIQPTYNVLAKATPAQIAGINFALAVGAPREATMDTTTRVTDFTAENVVLLPGFCAVISLISTQNTTASDISAVFSTECLF